MATLWLWDIDGSCLDSTHRDRFFAAGDYDAAWSRENLLKDVPMSWVLSADLWRQGQFRYADHYGYLTARHDDVYDATRDTLTQYGMWGENDPIGKYLVTKDTPKAPHPRHETVPHFKVRILLDLAKLHHEDVIVFVEDHVGTLTLAQALEHPRIHVVDSTFVNVADRLAHLADELGVRSRW